MSIHQESRTFNKKIWLIITQIAFDEQEAKDIINTILQYGHTTRKCCKQNEDYTKFLYGTFKDIATLNTIKPKKEPPKVKKVIKND